MTPHGTNQIDAYKQTIAQLEVQARLTQQEASDVKQQLQALRQATISTPVPTGAAQAVAAIASADAVRGAAASTAGAAGAAGAAGGGGGGATAAPQPSSSSASNSASANRKRLRDAEHEPREQPLSRYTTLDACLLGSWGSTDLEY